MADLTPGSWLALLEAQLDRQSEECRLFRAYYDGDHPLNFATAKMQEAFGTLFQAFANNWMQLVVDAAAERLAVQGFRFGEDQADDKAWSIWQANRLDAESIQAFTEAIKCGRSYLMVSPGQNGQLPRITVEHPQEVVVAHAAGDRRERHAALKRWKDVDGYAYATLYLPDVLVKWRSVEKIRNRGGKRIQWMLRPDDPGGRNTLGAVPIIPLENNPDILLGGRSDIAVVHRLQDAVNKLGSDMMVSSEFNAYPQRTATGIEIPTTKVRDAQGNETEEPDRTKLLRQAQSHMLVSRNEEAKFGTLEAASLGNFVDPIDSLIQYIAAQSRTPPHYLLGKMVNLSADALKAAETGLVARVKRKQVDFSDSLEDAMRLAFRAQGETEKAEMLDAETIWRDPESRAPGVIADSLVKKRQIGVPLETLWEEAGYTPQQIVRMKRLAGLPDRPPPGATTSQVPPPPGANGGSPEVAVP